MADFLATSASIVVLLFLRWDSFRTQQVLGLSVFPQSNPREDRMAEHCAPILTDIRMTSTR